MHVYEHLGPRRAGPALRFTKTAAIKDRAGQKSPVGAKDFANRCVPLSSLATVRVICDTVKAQFPSPRTFAFEHASDNKFDPPATIFYEVDVPQIVT